MKYSNAEKRDCSIVLIGKFNPEMFSPEWFLRHNIIMEEDVNFARSQKEKYPLIVSNQITMFVLNNLTIKIETNRFIVSATKEPFVMLKDFVCSTFNNLGSYEITAYGFNYGAHYKINNIHDYQLIGDNLAPKKYWSKLLEDDISGDDRKGGLVSIKMNRQNENGSKSIELQPSAFIKQGVFIACNDHHICDAENCDADVIVPKIELEFDNSVKEMELLQLNLLDEVLADE